MSPICPFATFFGSKNIGRIGTLGLTSINIADKTEIGESYAGAWGRCLKSFCHNAMLSKGECYKGMRNLVLEEEEVVVFLLLLPSVLKRCTLLL